MTASTAEVPVWVNGVQKWVTGVTRRTTCDELVRVLVSSEKRSSSELSDSDLRGFALVERWRQVERPLSGSDRILKVWKAWGEKGDEEVQFALKRVGPQTPKELKSQRRRHHSRHRWRSTSSLDTLHPRRLAAECSSGQQSDMVERLMKMIIVQGETIQAQLRRLREREDVISQYEHRLHQTRVDQLGSDYLLNTYLKDGEVEETEKKSNDSGVMADIAMSEASRAAAEAEVQPIQSLEDMRVSVDLLNRIAEINSRLVDHEEHCVKMGHKIRRVRSGSNVTSSSSMRETGDSGTVMEMEVSRTELQRLSSVCQRRQTEIQQVERDSVQHERLLEDRRCYMQYLEYELAVADEEAERLNAQLLQQQEEVLLLQQQEEQLPPVHQSTDLPPGTTTVLQKTSTVFCSADKMADSNSDTGLSSLDSSGDETAGNYMLETLV